MPTGIGCEIGGYAGDALPSARLLAAASGCLITHPNVINGAALYWSDPRIQYVEGYSLDRFAAGELGLRPVRQQRIGLLLDAGIEPELRQRQWRRDRYACREKKRRDQNVIPLRVRTNHNRLNLQLARLVTSGFHCCDRPSQGLAMRSELFS